MGTQQLMLVILGVIIVGIAIAVGIWLFSGTSVSSNKDAIINDLLNLSQHAYRWKLTPTPFGGGGRAFTGYVIPEALKDNEDATFVTTNVSPKSVTFEATSKLGFGKVSAVLDSAGVLGSYQYTGEFQ